MKPDRHMPWWEHVADRPRSVRKRPQHPGSVVSTPPLCVRRWLGGLGTCPLQPLASQAAAAEDSRKLRLSLIVAFPHTPSQPFSPFYCLDISFSLITLPLDWGSVSV